MHQSESGTQKSWNSRYYFLRGGRHSGLVACMFFEGGKHRGVGGTSTGWSLRGGHYVKHRAKSLCTRMIGHSNRLGIAVHQISQCPINYTGETSHPRVILITIKRLQIFPICISKTFPGALQLPRWIVVSQGNWSLITSYNTHDKPLILVLYLFQQKHLIFSPLASQRYSPEHTFPQGLTFSTPTRHSGGRNTNILEHPFLTGPPCSQTILVRLSKRYASFNHLKFFVKCNLIGSHPDTIKC